VPLTPRVLRGWPLPVAEDGDKEARGRVLVVGGAPELVGAPVLAAEAALRAGAGKLRVAVPAALAPLVGLALPEARVFSLGEGSAGAEVLREWAAEVDSVVLGPGLDEKAAQPWVRALLSARLRKPMVLDAGALAAGEALEGLREQDPPPVLTPHAGELAGMTGGDKEAIRADPCGAAREAAARWKAVVVLKGAETFIAAPDGVVYRNRAGNAGLATSGSGDVLAGVVGGLAARGLEPLRAAAWGVALHARAGDGLARKLGPVGYLARELPAEIPRLMARLSPPR
jgi:hydroxyethylthiazole kinase-like uncharacterized protein yjeF